MNLTDLDSRRQHHHLGELTSHITNDGSLSLSNSYYKESFHSYTGAIKEAKDKFVNPSQVNRFLKSKQLRVLDICFGIGYNSACLLEELKDTPINMNWWGLEIDSRPLKIALSDSIYRRNWSPSILKVLTSINDSSEWRIQRGHGILLWGDAREKLHLIPNTLKFDLIFHDAFSPQKCPQLWSEEFLHNLARKLAPNGRFITYSSSAAVRGSLKRAGLQLNTIIPITAKEKRWSSGTLAIRPSQENDPPNTSTTWRCLSKMEKEHLLTSAGIPYRDPNGKSNATEIHNRRRIEQENRNFESTNSWKKRWESSQSG